MWMANIWSGGSSVTWSCTPHPLWCSLCNAAVTSHSLLWDWAPGDDAGGGDRRRRPVV